MKRRLSTLSMFVLPVLFLSGCGDGYERLLSDEFFPYGNQRTAGSAVSYVRANMMPQKDLKLKPVKRTQKPEVQAAPPPVVEEPPAEAPLQKTKDILKNLEDDMEKVFEDAQRK